MVSDYLSQTAHVVHQVGHGDVGRRPHQPDSPEHQAAHRLLHEAEHVLDPAARLRLPAVGLLLAFRQGMAATV